MMHTHQHIGDILGTQTMMAILVLNIGVNVCSVTYIYILYMMVNQISMQFQATKSVPKMESQIPICKVL